MKLELSQLQLNKGPTTSEYKVVRDLTSASDVSRKSFKTWIRQQDHHISTFANENLDIKYRHWSAKIIRPSCNQHDPFYPSQTFYCMQGYYSSKICQRFEKYTVFITSTLDFIKLKFQLSFIFLPFLSFLYYSNNVWLHS